LINPQKKNGGLTPKLEKACNNREPSQKPLNTGALKTGKNRIQAFTLKLVNNRSTSTGAGQLGLSSKSSQA
jgi:hypothetical protein